MTFDPNAAEVFRDNVTQGVSASGLWSPAKSDVRTLLAAYEAALDGSLTDIDAASSTLDIAIPPGLSGCELRFHDLKPTANGSNLKLRLSTDGSTFLSANYWYAGRTIDTSGTATISNSASAAEIPLADAVSNAVLGNLITVNLNPTALTSFGASLSWGSQYYDNTSTKWKMRSGGGGVSANVSAVRLYFASDTFAGGSWSLVGRK